MIYILDPLAGVSISHGLGPIEATHIALAAAGLARKLPLTDLQKSEQSW